MGGNRCPHRGRRREFVAPFPQRAGSAHNAAIEAELDDIARLQIFGAAFYAAQAVFAVGAREKVPERLDAAPGRRLVVPGAVIPAPQRRRVLRRAACQQALRNKARAISAEPVKGEILRIPPKGPAVRIGQRPFPGKVHSDPLRHENFSSDTAYVPELFFVQAGDQSTRRMMPIGVCWSS